MEEAQESRIIISEKDILKTYPKNIQNIIKPQFKKEYLRIRKYKTAIHMKKRFGIGRIRISRFLNENPNTVGGWLYRNEKPKYFNVQNEIKELIE